MFAVPALAAVLGLGGVAQVQAHTPWKHLSEESKAELQVFKDEWKDEWQAAREEHRAHHPRVSAENRAAINAALEAGDYQAFAEATANAPFAGRVTEDKFEAMVEAMELRLAGDHEGARQVLEDAGMHRPSVLRSHRMTPPVPVE
jgi:hypothetical protein